MTPRTLFDTAEALRRAVKGEVILPGDASYDAARTVWNAMIDRRPAIIVRCAEAGDVPHALGFARERQLEVAVRGGGHNIAGSAVCDGGLVIDMSEMKAVVVDPQTRRASVQAGATLAEVDAATQEHGLATPLGINSTTGLAGLTLGGGFGWLTRQYGMTIDNLLSARMVTADGAVRSVSPTDHPDLFWAIRGGGGNFGVVTDFELRLHEVGPQIVAGLMVFPFEHARRTLRAYHECMAGASEAFNVWAILRQAPPLPFLPDSTHGQPVLILAAFHTGRLEEAERDLDRLRRFGARLGEHAAEQPYVVWQQAFDPLLTAGARNYWKTHNFASLEVDAVDCMVEYAGQLPSAQCEIFVGLIGGASNRVPPEAMAYGHRGARFVMNVHARWDHRDDDDRCIGWARRFFAASAPFASGGAYVNFMTDDERSRVAAAYGASYGRLAEIKRRYDPSNVFHLNQNIKP